VFQNMISRVHAKVFYKDNSWFIQNNKSVNGVYVNDVKLGDLPVPLKEGDIVVFGGNANQLPGAIKKQPNSEFIYQFKLTKKTTKSRRYTRKE